MRLALGDGNDHLYAADADADAVEAIVTWPPEFKKVSDGGQARLLGPPSLLNLLRSSQRDPKNFWKISARGSIFAVRSAIACRWRRHDRAAGQKLIAAMSRSPIPGEVPNAPPPSPAPRRRPHQISHRSCRRERAPTARGS